jgi:dihydropteroate synthase
MEGSVIEYAGKRLELDRPKVMGILNITPDSFFDGGFYPGAGDQLRQVEKMIGEGASVIDIGAVSTRPGSTPVDEEEETRKIMPAVERIRKQFPDIFISVDTFRTDVAARAIGSGADMINDIYGGRFDGRMLELVASHRIPYVMMHMQGTPADMQKNPQYGDVVKDIMDFFRERLALLPSFYNPVILDPGFGFGKTHVHNFTLLRRLDEFRRLGHPLMAGLSRKSLITRTLDLPPAEALNGTTVLNTIALLGGADILRVHDVTPAVEAIRLVGMLKSTV